MIPSIGRPDAPSTPRTFRASFLSVPRSASAILTRLAVLEPIWKLFLRRFRLHIDSLNCFPPTWMILEKITLVLAITEISVLCAPMLTIMEPFVRLIGMPSASASAIGLSTRYMRQFFQGSPYVQSYNKNAVQSLSYRRELKNTAPGGIPCGAYSGGEACAKRLLPSIHSQCVRCSWG